MRNFCIIGLGLLGGSFGLSLKKRLESIHILGVDISEDHARKALEMGLIDQIVSFEEGIKQADCVILATPVNAIVDQIGSVLASLKDGSVLLDLGSTKELICTMANQHEKRGQFVAAHHIAGTENSGPEAAFAELLEGKKIILCDVEDSDEKLLRSVELLLQKLGMQLEYMSSIAHDKHIAFVSHLSHISSFGLGSAVLDTERNEQNIFIMAGSGFDSTVRLAKSSPEMWAPIFNQNQKNVSEALGLYIKKLSEFKEYLDNHDIQKMYDFMKETNDISRVLKSPNNP